MNKRHAKWLEFIEPFLYVVQYKRSKENVVADALSRRYTLIFSLSSNLIGFEYIKYWYKSVSEFANVYDACEQVAFQRFYRNDRYLFKENMLCFPCSMLELLVKEPHNGGLMWHFGIAKTLDILQ